MEGENTTPILLAFCNYMCVCVLLDKKKEILHRKTKSRQGVLVRQTNTKENNPGSNSIAFQSLWL